ncbi:MAG: hypothetical protein JXM73_21895 [Anaerolineae bacterium]|nr:hypothetical protein [Anaerolineae bacterium]
MDLIALVLLTLVGYSAGATLGSRKHIATPGPLDLGSIVGLWIGALFSRIAVGKWLAVGIWFAVAVVLAWILVSIRRSHLPLDRPALPQAPGSLLSRMWAGWKRFAQQMGNFQGRVLLALFYFAIVTPFGLLVRAFSDPLHIKKRERTSFWLERPAVDADLEKTRSQF